MNRINILAIASIVALSLSTVNASVTGISIPRDSQNPLCRPAYDDIWTVTFPSRPSNANAGIGVIVKPDWISFDDNQDFALHQNNDIQPSPRYVAPNVPDPKTASVTYTFDHAEVISGVEIVQHVNGITEVEGFLGDSTDNLVSLGAVFGPSGDIDDGTWVVPSDGTPQVFNFGNTSISGTVLRIVIRKTSHSSAFATHRIYPLDGIGAPIPPATTTSAGLRTNQFGLTASVPGPSIAGSETEFAQRLTAPAFATGGHIQFSVAGSAGSQCKIQTSTNLEEWITLLTNTVPFTFTTSKSTLDKQRFYRAVSFPRGNDGPRSTKLEN